MNNTNKVLIGLGVAAAALVAGIIIKKKVAKKYTTKDVNGNLVDVDENPIDFKKAAEEKVEKILAFVTEHADDIGSIVTVIGLVTGLLELKNAIVGGNRLKRIEKKVDDLHKMNLCLMACELESYQAILNPEGARAINKAVEVKTV